MSNSLLRKYPIKTGEGENTLITITAFRTKNDSNGNPVYFAQVWGSSMLLWSGLKVKGYRLNKDNMYRFTSYNLKESLDDLAKEIQTAISVLYI
jgi:hypothetical protein